MVKKQAYVREVFGSNPDRRPTKLKTFLIFSVPPDKYMDQANIASFRAIPTKAHTV
jgi:hypothetical protein